MSLVVVNQQINQNQSAWDVAQYAATAAACNFTITAIFTNVDQGLVAGAYGAVASCVFAVAKHFFDKLQLDVRHSDILIAGASLATALFVTDMAADFLGHGLDLHLPGSVFYNLFLS